MSLAEKLTAIHDKVTGLSATITAAGVTSRDGTLGDQIAQLIAGYNPGGGGGVTVPQNMLIGEFTPEDNVTTCTLTDYCPGTMVGYLLLAPGLEYAAHEDTDKPYLFAAVGKTYMNRETWQAPVTGVKTDGNNYYSNNKVLAQSGSTINYSYGTMVLAAGQRYIFAIIYE